MPISIPSSEVGSKTNALGPCSGNQKLGKSPDFSSAPSIFSPGLFLSWLIPATCLTEGQHNTAKGGSGAGSEGDEKHLFRWLPLVWAAVALGARFPCDKGGCSGRAGERSNKHCRWEKKIGQPPTNKYRQGRATFCTAGTICLMAGKGKIGVRRGPISG